MKKNSDRTHLSPHPINSLFKHGTTSFEISILDFALYIFCEINLATLCILADAYCIGDTRGKSVVMAFLWHTIQI